MTDLSNKIESHKGACESFELSLSTKCIVYEEQADELLIHGGKPRSAGNVLTGETYDPDNFELGFKIKFCPFCGELLDSRKNDDDLDDLDNELFFL